MLENFAHMANGLLLALQPEHLLFAVIGCLLGTIVGMLPGLGPTAAIAILVPITLSLDTTASIIMLAALFYGATYGDTITAVLFNTPGTGGAAMTAVDGYPMAQKGRAGTALAIGAIASFVGGTLTVLALGLMALPITSFALRIGPPEFFAIIVMSLILVITLSSGSLVRGLIAAVFGLLIAMVGIDPVMGLPRLTFGQVHLYDGIAFVPVIIGLFGIAEIMLNIEKSAKGFTQEKLTSFKLTREDMRRSAGPIGRGTVLGFIVGVIPGLGNIPATFIAYATEKRISKTPEKFGTGMIEGVAAPEASSSASSNGALLPLLTLGIPGSPVVAVLMGAFMINGITPGPLMFRDHSDMVWTIISSMYIGNLVLLVLNLPLIPLWLTVLRIPYSLLFPLILGFAVIGSYSLANSGFDVQMMAIFGVVGYLCRKLDIPLVPLVVTLILGPMMESGLRLSMEISQGDFMIFLRRPIAAICLGVAVFFLLIPILAPVWRRLRVKRESA